VEISEFFFTPSQTSILQDPMVTFIQKCLKKKFDTYSRNGSFGAFWVKT